MDRKIGIICAGDKEFEPFIKHIENDAISEQAMLKIHEGKDIFDTVISTEVAYHDVFPTILTEFHPWMETEYFKADQKLIELSEIAVEKIKSCNNVVWGRMITGEQFIAEEGRKEINDRYAPLIVDMETASIAHVCYVNKVPFISIRCITDTAKHSGQVNFDKNCEKASGIAKDITIALIDIIKKEF